METNTITKTEKQSKITLATLKSFIRKNDNNLFINLKSDYSGMIDGLEFNNDGFKEATKDSYYNSPKHDLGYRDIYLVGGSRDYFKHYEDDKYIGIDCVNCCGHFIVATLRN